jgi:hypothetical protein
MSELKFFVRRSGSPFSQELEVWIRSRGRGPQAVAQPVVFRVPENEAVQEAPAFRMDYTAAQDLMDELWLCGFRPSEGTGSAGSLAATQNHLKDMRAIAGKLLKCELP